MRRQQPQIVGVEIGGEADRRREIAVGRKHRAFVHTGKDEALRGLVQHQQAALEFLSAGKREPQVAAVPPDQAGDERNDHRLFRRLARCGWDRLREFELVGFCVRIVMAGGRDLGRTSLRIPALEL